MKNSKILKTILIISGLIATAIGASILFVPEWFYASYGITLDGRVSLINELSASGGAVLASGVFILLGAFMSRLTFTAIVISTLLFLSYGLSRIVSMISIGMPVEGLIQAATLEIIIGGICLYALVKFNNNTSKPEKLIIH